MELKRQKRQVIMLPTEDKTDVIYNNSLNFMYHTSHKDYSHWGVEQSDFLNYQHLHILSDEKIEEGDWYLLIDPAIDGSHSRYSIYQATKGRLNSMKIMKSCTFKKIIATTDEQLRIQSTVRNADEGDMNYGRVLFILPKPSKAFVKKYCKMDGIDEVDVEYFLQDIFLKEGQEEYWTLKIVDYEITLHPVKSSWDKEELTAKCKQAFMAGGKSGYNSSKGLDFQTSDEWIKENI